MARLILLRGETERSAIAKPASVMTITAVGAGGPVETSTLSLKLIVTYLSSDVVIPLIEGVTKSHRADVARIGWPCSP